MIKIKDYFIPEDDNHFREYFKRFDHYQEAQRNRALSHVMNWRLAIDVGANIGLWSKDLTSYFDKTICFEPNINCIECLKKNINNAKSQIYNLALGSEDTKLNLFTPSFSGGSSFINETKIGVNEDGSKVYGPFSENVPTNKVEVTTLDSYNLKNIDFIKIDVQGFEMKVLKGALKTLKNNEPIICIEENKSELSMSETINFLIKLEYEVIDRISKEVILKKI